MQKAQATKAPGPRRNGLCEWLYDTEPGIAPERQPPLDSVSHLRPPGRYGASRHISHLDLAVMDGQTISSEYYPDVWGTLLRFARSAWRCRRSTNRRRISPRYPSHQQAAALLSARRDVEI